jgi:hypothetical protein
MIKIISFIFQSHPEGAIRRSRWLTFSTWCGVFFAAYLSMITTTAHAFSCYATLVKDSCWSNYTVSIDVVDTKKNKVLVTLFMPIGTDWDRETFDCDLGANLALKATFSPTMWRDQADRVYSGKSYWLIPKDAPTGVVAWNLTRCFPEDFAEVPVPIEATDHCTCSMKDIPALPAYKPLKKKI